MAYGPLPSGPYVHRRGPLPVEGRDGGPIGRDHVPSVGRRHDSSCLVRPLTPLPFGHRRAGSCSCNRHTTGSRCSAFQEVGRNQSILRRPYLIRLLARHQHVHIEVAGLVLPGQCGLHAIHAARDIDRRSFAQAVAQLAIDLLP